MRGISLIMPVYHAGKRPEEEIDHFREALDSIVDLLHDPRTPKFELIIVDDASKNPQTRRWMSIYAKNHSWIKTITLDENKGPSFARNRALDIAQYDYVAGVDADDILTAKSGSFYREAIRRLKADESIAYINPKIIEFGRYNRPCMVPKYIRDTDIALYGYSPVCAVLRTDDVRAVDGWHDDAPKAEDWKLAVDILAMRWRAGKPSHAITLPGVSYLYRQHGHGENVNARPVDKLRLRRFLMDGNEDFYRDRFGTDKPEEIMVMHGDFKTRMKHGAFRALFENMVQHPISTSRNLLSRSKKIRRVFNAARGILHLPQSAPSAPPSVQAPEFDPYHAHNMR